MVGASTGARKATAAQSAVGWNQGEISKSPSSGCTISCGFVGFPAVPIGNVSFQSRKSITSAG